MCHRLPKDKWLRKQMDGEYWVELRIIVGFQRIKKLGQPDAMQIAAALQGSDLMDVSADGMKIRRNRPLQWQLEDLQAPAPGQAVRWEWQGDGHVCESARAPKLSPTRSRNISHPKMSAGTAYSSEASAKIEAALGSGEQKVDVDDSHARYVDTTEMKQYVHGHPSRWRRVRRRPLAEGVPPA